MNKIKFLLLSWISVCSILIAEVPESDLVYVPYYANLNEALELGGNRIAEGTRFIVIRVEEDRVKVNFSRKGIHEIHLSKTNIKDLISQQKKINLGSSRIAYFIGNKIASGESNWKKLIHLDEINQYEQWVFFYAASSDSNIRKWLINLNKLCEKAKVDSPKTLFLYIDTEGNQQNLEKLGAELDLSISSLPWYLSKGYVKGFDHLDNASELPAIVFVSSTNNINSIHSGEESVERLLFNKDN